MIHFWLLTVRKVNGGEESFFSYFLTQKKLLSFCQNLALKLAHKWRMNCLSIERKDTSCHIMSQKDQRYQTNFTFDIPKFKFQNRLKQKTSNCLAFFRQTALWEPNPPTNLQDCEDVGTSVGWWIKWNDGVTVFSDIFYDNVVLTGKPSYNLYSRNLQDQTWETCN